MTLSLCSPKQFPCAGALNCVHIRKGFTTALVKYNCNLTGSVEYISAELKTYFTEACDSVKESVLHLIFLFIY